MPYCTLDDILAAMPEQDLIELTDDAPTAEMVDTLRVEAAIAGAGELIDGYLRGRYVLPLSPVPLLLNTLAVDITRYRLYGLRIRITPAEMVVQSYKDAIKLLEQIQVGKVSLGTEAIGGGVAPATGGVQVTAPDRVFTRENLGDY
jgi:phage gp36-like protein